MDQYNTWFYTLSTIAQVCAAVIALFAMFVVYKLDKINTNIDNLTKDILSKILLLSEFHEEYSEYIINSPEFILKKAEEHLDKNNAGVTRNTNFINALKDNIYKKNNILKRFKYSLSLNILSIISSILGLSLSRLLINDKILFPIVFICIISLIYTGFSVYNISIDKK